MPSKKPAPKNKSKPPGKPQKRSGLGQFFRVVTSTPVRQLILVVVIVVLLGVFWDNIEEATGNIIKLFGWGLVFIVAAIVTPIVMIWRRKPGLFFRHFNRWLGGCAFVLAAWGILGFLKLGGEFGRRIIFFYTTPDAVGALVIVALVIIGAFLVAPRSCFRLLKKFFAWVGK